MMLRVCCSSGDFGRENYFPNSIHNRICVSCKLQTFHSPPFIDRVSLLFPRDKSRVLLGFKLHNQSRRRNGYIGISLPSNLSDFKGNFNKNPITCASNQNPKSGNRISVGFNFNSAPKTFLPPKRNDENGTKKRYSDGDLPSNLHVMDTEDDDDDDNYDDIEESLKYLVEKLDYKGLTAILNKQWDWRQTLRLFRYLKSEKDYIPYTSHYNVVLRVLSRAQRWDELRLCWIEMARDGVLPCNYTYAILIDGYAKAGLVNEALLWLKHMRQRSVFPDEVTATTVVRVLKDAKEFDRAEKFYKDWRNGRVEIDDLDFDYIDAASPGLGPISPKYFLSTELFKEGGRIPPSKIVSPADMESSLQIPRLAATYNTIIDMYGKAGRLKEASHAFAEMLRSGVIPDTLTFNTMIFICGTHGKLLEAESLLRKMEERGPPPDTTTYNILISLYAKTGNIDMALEWYWKIREVGLFPNVETYRAILKILCDRNMSEEVEAVIQEMEKFGKHIDQHSLPVIIRLYIGKGLLEKAKILLEKCQLQGEISSKTYAAIIDVYADKGLWNEAELVFFRKQERVAQRKDVVEYNVMIKAYGKSKLYDKALSLFKSMRSNGTWPNTYTYNSVVQMLSDGDVVDPATDLLVEMQGAGFKPRCATFSAVIASNTRLGRIFDAVNVYREMTKAGVKPNEAVYGSLINGFAEAGMIEEALHYFRMMEEYGLSANQIVLTSLIKAYGKVGLLERAEELYGKIMDMEGGPDALAANTMINLYAELGMVSEARLIFDKLRDSGRADGIAYATITHLYKRLGMKEEALNVAQEMQDSGLLMDNDSFNTVMTSYALNRQLKECGELLKQMMTLQILPNHGTYKVMFTLLKRGGLPDEAVEQLESCYTEGKPYARLAIITSVFSTVGLHSYALECCKAFRDAEFGLDSLSYNVAIYAYGSSGKVDEALNIFMKMQDKGLEPDLVTFINLLGCYGKAGMLEGVKRIHNKLQREEIEPNESLYEAVIDAYTNIRRRDLAELARQEMKFAFDQDHSDSETDENPEYLDEDYSENDEDPEDEAYSDTDEDPEDEYYSETDEDPEYWDTDSETDEHP